MSATASSAIDMFSLGGKTVIVTGATGGIGLTLAVAFAEAGADIVSIQMANDPGSKSLAEKIEATGRKLLEFESNLKDYKSIPATFERIWAAGVVPDILLNSAGITRVASVEDTPFTYLDDVMDINFKAAYVVSQEFGRRLMKLERPGKIIHMASMAADLVQTDISVYASSKGAVRNLTRALSNEWASKGIQVNCISPGWIKTPMTAYLWQDSRFSSYVVERTSARRWGEPKDLSGVAIFLASRASDFVTGENIVVDGGVIGR